MIKLRASALPRILACLGSASISPPIPEDMNTDAAREGTAAHAAAEYLLIGAAIPDVAPNGVPIDADMREHAAAYVASIPLADAHPEHRYVETLCSFAATEEVQVGAKIDVAWLNVALTDLYIRDFKYGWRIVNAEENATMLAYAVGMVRHIYAVAPSLFVDRGPDDLRIHLGIYQPRPYHPDGPLRECTITLGELMIAWAKICDTLERLPSDELATGDHCEQCPAAILGTCPAYLRATANAIDVAMRGGAIEVPASAVGKELVNLKRASDVLKSRLDWLQDIAKRALKTDANAVPGWGLEVQYGNRVWTADAEALKQLTNVDVLQPPKLVTPAEALRRGVSQEVYDANTKRPLIGDKLVRRDPDAEARKALKRAKKPKAAK